MTTRLRREFRQVPPAEAKGSVLLLVRLREPHRAYKKDQRRERKRLDRIVVPAYLPDPGSAQRHRRYLAIERFDATWGA
jgi:hypothetical protein